jgi:hypothetical protein
MTSTTRSEIVAKRAISKVQPTVLPGRVPDIKPGKFKDGTPLHQVQFLECKIILKSDRFTSADNFGDYAKVVKRTALEKEV